MFLQTYLVLCFACVCFSTDYNIVWDQNYCDNKDRYPSSYELPHNSPCALCINDVITLRINSTSSDHYENIYRVPNEEQMLNCNATVSDNNVATFFKDMHEIEILNAGSNPAFNFQLQVEPYYFISTSDGSQSSAQNNLLRPPNSCLQFAFRVLLATDSRCGSYKADCVFSSVFNDSTSSLFCSTLTNPPISTDTTQITNAPEMSTTIMQNTTTLSIASNTTSTNTTLSPTPKLTTTTTTAAATTPSRVSKGLAIIFYVYTTDSPGAIAGLSILLVICILMILLITPSGIIFLVLYWYGKIKFYDKKYFLQNTKQLEERISHSSYKEATGKIELGDIGYPMAPQLRGTTGNVGLIEYPTTEQVNDEPTYSMNLREEVI